MKNTAGNILPENYILAVLSPEERLDAAFTVAKQAFKKTKLTMKDIDAAVKNNRKSIAAVSARLLRGGVS